ncbi:hypothetical protein CXF68_15315 [Tenacibaculum sp. Bg11-29]|uniref:T9SS type A sorting domain-containing protein n=1 Tax=Tenacibaculum sp. Bg11-29 TaxID=2058306 RepID=UPI000C33959D|nr:T9SS type A sorting domain-containing protein [Tenacibaculum sp. Bg11-29]PKH51972.1 hypothetical protein CXF68_15315 [Tenacibaculum sp. Bg11-29]
MTKKIFSFLYILFAMLAITTMQGQETDPNDLSLYYKIQILGPDAGVGLSTEVETVIKEHNTGTEIAINKRGVLSIVPTGGTAPYKFYVYKDGSTTPLAESNRDINNANEERIVDNLLPGNYVVEIRDANYSSSPVTACNTISKTVVLKNPTLLEISASPEAIKCKGDKGKITISVKGGIKPIVNSGKYKVALFLGGILQEEQSVNYNETTYNSCTFTGYPAGNYRVVVSDRYVSKEYKDIIVTQPAASLTINIVSDSIKDVSCNNTDPSDDDGSVEIQATGGTVPYSLLLNNASSGITYTPVPGTFTNTKAINNLSVGTYNVKVKDANNCVRGFKTFTIEEPISPLIITPTPGIQGNTTSTGGVNGFVEYSVTGGTPNPNYTYSFKGANTTAPNAVDLSGSFPGLGVPKLFNNLRADTYILIITDDEGCINEEEIVISDPAPIEIDFDKTHVSCFGGNDGTITAKVIGGASNKYHYEWTKVGTGVIAIPTPGTASITVSEGTYIVKVTVIYDFNPVEIKNSTEVIITQPIQPLSIAETIKDVSCKGGNDGNIQLTVTGGTQPYTYSWKDIGDTEIATTKDITAQLKGSYKVIVTDAKLCSVAQTYTINEPIDDLIVALDSAKDPLSFNGTNGSINISVTGGNGGYSYVWTNSLGIQVGTSEDLIGIGAETYKVMVTDAKGCTDEISQTLSQPDELIATVTIPTDGVLFCNGDADGKLEVTVSGGLVPYTYHWYEVLSNGSKSFLSGETNITVEGLVAGDYGVEVTDRNGLGIKVYDKVKLSEPNKVIINTPVITDVDCHGNTTGAITLDVVGGTGAYVYEWYKIGTTTPISTSKDLIGREAGQYKVIVQDTNNCPSIPLEEIITINQPASELSIDSATEVVTNATGFEVSDGSIKIDVLGGTPFDPSGSPHYNYSLIEKSLGTVVAMSNLVTGLAGTVLGITYEMTITDANGCQLQKEYTIHQPEKLIVKLGLQTAIRCNGENGTLNATVTGGYSAPTPVYTYKWYNKNDLTTVIGELTTLTKKAGAYRLVVEDEKGNTSYDDFELLQNDEVIVTYTKQDVTCYSGNDGAINLSVSGGTGIYTYVWSNGQRTEDVSSLTSGDYNVTVSDENGCSKKVLITIAQPSEYKISLNLFKRPTGKGLSNGKIEVEVIGGDQPDIFEWKDENGIVIGNTKSITDIPAGKYTFFVTDKKGCKLQETYNLGEPEELLITLNQNNIILCNGGSEASVKATVTGGVIPYQYTWYDSENTLISNEVILTNVKKGSYYLVIKDSENNQKQSVAILISQPELLKTELESTPGNCGTANDWTITANTTGGTLPYKYFWSTGATTQNITNMSLGSYFVMITDANGCQTTQNIVLENTSPLTINVNVTDVNCYNTCTGTINLDIAGGLAPYTVAWNTGDTGKSIVNACKGEYIATITDKKGCTIVKTITIKNTDEVVFSLVPNKVTLCYGETIEYDVTMNDVSKYSWTSDNGFTSNESIVTLSEGGKYTLTVTTTKGCIIVKELEILKSDVKIDAQLILTSQAFVGEDIAIINVSNPISSNIAWSIPSNVTIVQQTDEGLVLRFPAPGNYNIALVATEGNCIKRAIKTVTVLKSRNLDAIGDTKNPFIKEFKVYANPNKGNFKVDIVLEKESEVSLRLFSLSANSVVADKRLKGLKEYTANYEMNLSVGIYVLLLETPKGKRIRKVIIE